jgi:hypothetical protein
VAGRDGKQKQHVEAASKSSRQRQQVEVSNRVGRQEAAGKGSRQR